MRTETLGHRIRRLRVARGLSVGQFAAFIGHLRHMVTRWEVGT